MGCRGCRIELVRGRGCRIELVGTGMSDRAGGGRGCRGNSSRARIWKPHRGIVDGARMIGAAGRERVFRSRCSPHRVCEVPNFACNVRFEMDLRQLIRQERLNNFPDTPGPHQLEEGIKRRPFDPSAGSGSGRTEKRERVFFPFALTLSLPKGLLLNPNHKSSARTEVTTSNGCHYSSWFGSLPPPLLRPFPERGCGRGVAEMFRRS